MVVLNWKGGLGNVTLSPTAAPLGVPYQTALPSLWPPLPPSNALPGERGIYFLVETDSETGEIKYTNGQPTFIIDSDGFKIPYGYTTYKTDDLINNGTLEDDVVVIGFPPGGDLGDLYSNALNLTTIRLGDGNDSFRIVGNGITQTVKTEVSIEASQGYIFQSNIFAGSGDDYVSVLMPWQSIFRGGTNTNYGPSGLNLELDEDLTLEEVPYGDTIQLKGSRADWDIEFRDGNGDGVVSLASILSEQDYIATSNNNRIYGFERLKFGDILFDLVLYKQLPSNAIYGQPEFFLFGNETAPELNSSTSADLWQAFLFNRTKLGGIAGQATGAAVDPDGAGGPMAPLPGGTIYVATGDGNDTPYLTGSLAYALLDTGKGDDLIQVFPGNQGDTTIPNDAFFGRGAYFATINAGDGNDVINVQSKQNTASIAEDPLSGPGYTNPDYYYSSVEAGSGDDLVYAFLPYASTFNGGLGTDTILLYGTRSDWDLEYVDGNRDGILDVTNSNGIDYIVAGGVRGYNIADQNRIFGFEKIQFNDVLLNLTTPPPDASADAIGQDLLIRNLPVAHTSITAPLWDGLAYNRLALTGAQGTAANRVVINTGAGNDTPRIGVDASGQLIPSSDGLPALRFADLRTDSGNDLVAIGSADQSTIDTGGDADSIQVRGNLTSTRISGGSENDTILLGGPTSLSAATIDGGLGTDTLVVSGLRSSWKLSPESDGLGNLTGIRASATGLSSSLFTGIEIFQFDDWKTSENPGPGVKLAGIADTIASSIRATEWERLGFDYLTITGITGTSLLPITVETGNAANDIALQDSIAWATIATGSGTDTIKAVGATHTTIYTESDNDNITFSGAFVNSNLNSGTGSDSITLGSASAVTIVAGTAAEADNDSIKVVGDLSNWVTLATGAGDDSISGAGATQTTVYTEAGNDTVVFTGAFVNSNLDSGAGSDWIKLGSASAVTIVAGTDAEADNDSVTVVGDLANTVIRGGGGFDTLRIEGVFAPNTVNRSGVTDGSGTYHQLGSNRFYGFESITIVNPPLSFSTIPSINGGLGGGSPAVAASQDNIIFGGMGRSRKLRATSRKDIFQYDARRGFTSRDDIINFKAGVDKMLIGGVQRSSPIGKALKGATTGRLLTTVNRSNQVERSRTLLVYNSRSGELFYNANGSQSGLGRGGGLIADFSPNVRLSNSDFLFSYVDPLA